MNTTDSSLTTVLVICLAISLLTGISLAFTVLIRQNAKKVKAPVWFPPPAPGTENNYQAGDYESIKRTKKSTMNKAFNDFSNFFFTSSSSQSTSSEKHLQESPSSSSDSNQSDLYSKPIKMRKLDQSKAQMIYHNNRPHSPPSPGCYPSPPESLSPNDQLTQHNQQQNPINLKGGSYCITPLMVFIMGRSKLQHSQAQKNPNFTDHLNDADVVETFVSSGADLNSQNLDGETALHLAVRCGLYNICERLIQHGAELNSTDTYGRNVLHTACGSNQYNIVKLILEHCTQQLNMSS